MHSRTRRWLKGSAAAAGLAILGGITSGVASSQDTAQPRGSAAARCAALAGTQVETGVVEGAEWFAAGATVTGGETAGAKTSTNLCRARLRLKPVPGSDIKVEVWLPEQWNGKLYGFGGAGFDGGLNPGAAALLDRTAGQGYVAVANDAGHTPAQSVEPWVHKQPEKVVDFGHRAAHLAAVTAKQVIKAYYGEPAKRAYFLGCSNGGREGLMLAWRYPQDYDGIIAGAPARRYVEILTQMTWHSQVIHGPGGAPKLESKLGLVHEAVMRKCDALDGVKDGLLENPLVCRFDPAELQCKGDDAATCLTAAEVGAMLKIYGGPRLRSGEPVYSGPALGAEGSPEGWAGWITPTRVASFGQEFYRWLVYDDPAWNVETFDLDRDYPAALKRLSPIINATDPDLGAFVRRGGKLIIYQGWNDTGINPTDNVAFYEKAARRFDPNGDHMRLFMVPGMEHCAGGPGASSFDMQPALEKWVEEGEAPERVVAVKPGAEPPFSRPLCPWPQTARYNGSGSIRQADNFTCKAPGRS